MGPLRPRRTQGGCKGGGPAGAETWVWGDSSAGPYREGWGNKHPLPVGSLQANRTQQPGVRAPSRPVPPSSPESGSRRWPCRSQRWKVGWARCWTGAAQDAGMSSARCGSITEPTTTDLGDGHFQKLPRAPGLSPQGCSVRLGAGGLRSGPGGGQRVGPVWNELTTSCSRQGCNLPL